LDEENFSKSFLSSYKRLYHGKSVCQPCSLGEFNSESSYFKGRALICRILKCISTFTAGQCFLSLMDRQGADPPAAEGLGAKKPSKPVQFKAVR
jgi:hypothetical protein